MTTLRPVTLITGASAGIGAELARVFARQGHEVALVARRASRLQALADEILTSGGRKPLVIAADLSKPNAVEQIAIALAAENAEPQFVVNNAGFGLVGQAVKLNRGEQLEMIDVNVRSLTELSLAFTDSLARHRGGILNVGSIAGFAPGPGMAVYYASKAYVVSFSEALAFELAPLGIGVTALCPGPVATEFAQRAGAKTRELAPSSLRVSATRVADEGYRGLMQRRRIVIPGWPNKIIAAVLRFIPRGLVLAIIGRRQRKRLT